MALIGTLVSFSPGTKIVSADVNTNFSAIRNAFNNSAVLTDTITTITVTHSFSTGFVVSGGQIGGSVTFASVVTVASGGLSITAGNVGIGSAVQTQNALRISGQITSGSVSQFGTSIDITGNSGATSEIGAAVYRAQTQASAYTCANVYGLHIVDAVQGAGSQITVQYGLKIDNQTKGVTNYALNTGTGLVAFGGNVTCAASLNVAGAAIFAGSVTANSLTVSTSFSAASFTATGSMTASSFQATNAIFNGVGAMTLQSDGTTWANIASLPNIVSVSAHFKMGSLFNVAMTTVVTSATLGYIFLTAMAGTASGVPNHPEGGGGVAIAYDTTNNRLMVYNGAWKSSAALT
jgi:hypothetical protein